MPTDQRHRHQHQGKQRNKLKTKGEIQAVNVKKGVIHGTCNEITEDVKSRKKKEVQSKERGGRFGSCLGKASKEGGKDGTNLESPLREGVEEHPWQFKKKKEGPQKRCRAGKTELERVPWKIRATTKSA